MNGDFAGVNFTNLHLGALKHYRDIYEENKRLKCK